MFLRYIDDRVDIQAMIAEITLFYFEGGLVVFIVVVVGKFDLMDEMEVADGISDV